MNNKDTKHIFARARKLKQKGLLPTNTSDWKNEPTALSFTDFTKAIATYTSEDLYQAFLTGYKMGLLEVDETQSDAEFNSFKRKLKDEEE